MAIGSMIAVSLRYARGKCHYMRYLKWAFYGSVFGLTYSFYFVNQKVEYIKA
jgi:hypothetical protein